MVVFLSYVIAVILTVGLAVCLYPLCAIFWISGLLGKISNGMFNFTNGVIKKLWQDIKGSSVVSNDIPNNNNVNINYNNDTTQNVNSNNNSNAFDESKYQQ